MELIRESKHYILFLFFLQPDYRDGGGGGNSSSVMMKTPVILARDKRAEPPTMLPFPIPPRPLLAGGFFLLGETLFRPPLEAEDIITVTTMPLYQLLSLSHTRIEGEEIIASQTA